MKKSATEILIEKNISITSPRILIIEEILKNKNPISIEKLQKQLEGRVALSTLYRALNDLKSVEIKKSLLLQTVLQFLKLLIKRENIITTSSAQAVEIL